MTQFKVYIQNENCLRAGQEVPEEYDGNPDKRGDWHVVEGTREELLELAKQKGVGHQQWYDRQCAITILRTIGWQNAAIDRLIYNYPQFKDEGSKWVCQSCYREFDKDDGIHAHSVCPGEDCPSHFEEIGLENP